MSLILQGYWHTKQCSRTSFEGLTRLETEGFENLDQRTKSGECRLQKIAPTTAVNHSQ